MRRWVALLVLAAAAALLLAPPASAADRDTVDAYLRQVSRQVERPGVYVDPLVVRQGKLTPAQIDAIRALARRQSSSLHILVLPASRLTVDEGGVTSAHLAYAPPDLIARLHRVVGKAGTYALLTSAPNQAAGQSFYAYQWAGDGPVYRTGAAVQDAIDCCAPDYHTMLRRFVARSDVPRGSSTHVLHQGDRVQPDVGDDDLFDTSSGNGGFGTVFLVIIALGVLGAVVAVARTISGSGSGFGSRRSGGRPVSVDELRAPLAEEIEQVRQEISAADTSTGAPDPAVAARLASARQALDRAHARSLTMSSADDARAVAGSLADARYETAAAIALRDGLPLPARTPPCFVDPRHGPSVTTRLYPPSGLNVAVPVCAACDASLIAGSQPVARSFQWGGNRYYPWMAYGPAWLYLTAYWGGQPFVSDLDHHASFLDAGGQPGPDSGGGSGFGGLGGFGGGGMGGGGFGGGFGGGGGGWGRHGWRRRRGRRRRRRHRRRWRLLTSYDGPVPQGRTVPDRPTPGRGPVPRPSLSTPSTSTPSRARSTSGARSSPRSPRSAADGIPHRHFVIDTSDNGRPFTGAWFHAHHPNARLSYAGPAGPRPRPTASRWGSRRRPTSARPPGGCPLHGPPPPSGSSTATSGSAARGSSTPRGRSACLAPSPRIRTSPGYGLAGPALGSILRHAAPMVRSPLDDRHRPGSAARPAASPPAPHPGRGRERPAAAQPAPHRREPVGPGARRTRDRGVTGRPARCAGTAQQRLPRRRRARPVGPRAGWTRSSSASSTCSARARGWRCARPGRGYDVSRWPTWPAGWRRASPRQVAERWREHAWSVAAVRITPDLVVLRKRNRHLLRLREADVPGSWPRVSRRSTRPRSPGSSPGRSTPRARCTTTARCPT